MGFKRGMAFWRTAFLTLALSPAFFWGTWALGAGLFQAAPTLGYAVTAAYPHDPSGFTQGLLYVDGRLYQSDGQYGRSRLVLADLESGRILQETVLPPEYFGEGLALAEDRLYQLTWREGRVFLYDKDSLAKVGELTLGTEGWGVTFDGKRLIVSDGTSVLRFYEPRDMRETGRIMVTDAGRPVGHLNELEWVKGRILANVWGSDLLAEIDPVTGKVLSWRDLSALREGLGPLAPGSVLNGVAVDAKTGRLLVTGKRWPKLFEIELTGSSQ